MQRSVDGSPPRIAAIGSATWDVLITVRHYPIPPGDSDLIHRWVAAPGGTTANTAVALARLGARVSLAGLVGSDPEGETLLAHLGAEGVDTTWMQKHPTKPTDACIIVVSETPPTRTIFWQKGARLGPEHPLDVPAIGAHDVVFLDVDDGPLHAELTARLEQLPASNARVLAGLQYPAGTASDDPPWPDALPLLLRHDVVTGAESEWLKITGATSPATLVRLLQEQMRHARLAACYITRGERGCAVCTADYYRELAPFRVRTADPTGAGDAFAAGVAYGLAAGWNWQRTGRFANAVGALATRALGAQAALPTPAEVNQLIDRRWVDMAL